MTSKKKGPTTKLEVTTKLQPTSTGWPLTIMTTAGTSKPRSTRSQPGPRVMTLQTRLRMPVTGPKSPGIADRRNAGDETSAGFRVAPPASPAAPAPHYGFPTQRLARA